MTVLRDIEEESSTRGSAGASTAAARTGSSRMSATAGS